MPRTVGSSSRILYYSFWDLHVLFRHIQYTIQQRMLVNVVWENAMEMINMKYRAVPGSLLAVTRLKESQLDVFAPDDVQQSEFFEQE